MWQVEDRAAVMARLFEWKPILNLSFPFVYRNGGFKTTAAYWRLSLALPGKHDPDSDQSAQECLVIPNSLTGRYEQSLDPCCPHIAPFRHSPFQAGDAAVLSAALFEKMKALETPSAIKAA